MHLESIKLLLIKCVNIRYQVCSFYKLLVFINSVNSFRRHFHKGSARWGVVPVKEAKTYSYITELMKAVYIKRVEDPSTQISWVVLEEEDPRRLAPTITPQQPPPTTELVRAHVSRF